MKEEYWVCKCDMIKSCVLLMLVVGKYVVYARRHKESLELYDLR